MAFKVLCVDHVGVAVKDLALIKQQMKDILGLDPSLPDETVEDQHVTTSFFKPSRRPKLANSNSWVPQLRMARSLVSLKNPTAGRTASSMLLFVLTTSKHASQICRLKKFRSSTRNGVSVQAAVISHSCIQRLPAFCLN